MRCYVGIKSQSTDGKVLSDTMKESYCQREGEICLMTQMVLERSDRIGG